MRIVAQIFSVIFHPVVLFVYIMAILLVLNPYMFGFNNIYEAKDWLFLICVMVIPIPLITVFLLTALGWADSIYLKNKEERIAPYLVTGLLYLTLYLQLAKSNGANAFQVTTLSAVIILFVAFFINNFYKISLHAAGAGALVSVIVLAVMFYAGETFIVRVNELYLGEYQTIHLLYATIILTGIICVSRLYLKQHSVREVYSGLVLGFFAPLIAYYIIT